jgi:hypothetical protein
MFGRLLCPIALGSLESKVAVKVRLLPEVIQYSRHDTKN